MSLSVTVYVSDTLEKLDRMVKNINNSENIIEFDADEMINEIVLRARYNAPYDTGRHAESIHAEGSFPNYTIIADARNEYGQYYSQYLEFGTSRMEAQPHIWPAIYEVMGEYKQKISRDFKDFMRGI
jgi:HK97 gp10 family phage protein